MTDDLAPPLAALAVVSLWIALHGHRRIGAPARRPTIDRARRVRPQLGRRTGRRLALARTLPPIMMLVATGSVSLTIAAVIATACWPTLRRRRQRQRRRSDLDRQLPGAIELLVLLVRAGLTPHQAVRLVPTHLPEPTRSGFVAVTDRLDHGDRLPDALAALTTSLGPAVGPVADALAVAERYGLPLDAVLDQLARDARDARRRLAEADARTLPVRLAFPLVVCTLPAFVLMAIVPAALAALDRLGDTAW